MRVHCDLSANAAEGTEMPLDVLNDRLCVDASEVDVRNRDLGPVRAISRLVPHDPRHRELLPLRLLDLSARQLNDVSKPIAHRIHPEYVGDPKRSRLPS